LNAIQGDGWREIMRHLLRRSIVTALGATALGILAMGSASADGIPAPQYPPPPPPSVYQPAPPVVQQYVAPPPVVVYAYPPPPPPVIAYAPPPPPAPVVVVPRPYYWGGYRPVYRTGPVVGPYFAHGYGRPWGGGFRHW
jgi:hypothetical protein